MPIWLRSSGLQLLRDKADDYTAVVNGAPPIPGGQDIITTVNEALDYRVLGIHAPRYDVAWAALYRLRHLFCKSLSPDDLLARVVEEVAEDVAYLDAADAVTKVKNELADLRTKLAALIAVPNANDERVVRARLEAVSRRVGDARASRWLKVNMKRARLALMGVLLGFALVLALAALPAIVNGRSHPFFVALAVAGAAGGLVSSLFTSESVDAKAPEFYVNRRLLYLRPLVGATVALASYFAVQSGTLSVVGIDKGSKPTGFLVLAFAAGFSERMFVNKVVSPLAGRSSKA